jgi:LacI family transcriptional regulator
MALVGYDDVEFAGLMTTPLTSVRQPKYQLGRAAADLLLAEAAAGPDHRHDQLLFQPELVVRESSAG